MADKARKSIIGFIVLGSRLTERGNELKEVDQWCLVFYSQPPTAGSVMCHALGQTQCIEVQGYAVKFDREVLAGSGLGRAEASQIETYPRISTVGLSLSRFLLIKTRELISLIPKSSTNLYLYRICILLKWTRGREIRMSGGMKR